MLNTSTQNIVALLEKLTKNEKTYFKKYSKLYVEQHKTQVEQLFDCIVMNPLSNDKDLMQTLQLKTKNQLNVLKNNMYNQLLESLASFQKDQIQLIKQNEKLNHILLLKSKSLYTQAWKYSLAFEKQLLKNDSILELYNLIIIMTSIVKHVPNINIKIALNALISRQNLYFEQLMELNQYYAFNSKMAIIHFTGKHKDIAQQKEATAIMQNKQLQDDYLPLSHSAEILKYAISMIYNANENKKEKAFQNVVSYKDALIKQYGTAAWQLNSMEQMMSNMIAFIQYMPHSVEIANNVSIYLTHIFDKKTRIELRSGVYKSIKKHSHAHFIASILLANAWTASKELKYDLAMKYFDQINDFISKTNASMERFFLELIQFYIIRILYYQKKYQDALFKIYEYYKLPESQRSRYLTTLVMTFEVIVLNELNEAYELANHLQKLFRFVKKSTTQKGIENMIQNFIFSLKGKCNDPAAIVKLQLKTLEKLKQLSRTPQMQSELSLFNFIEYLELKLNIIDKPQKLTGVYVEF